jgi:gas vesicle protein
MYKFVQFLSGVIVGAVTGAAVVLLLAPQGGEETRRQIKQRIETVVEEGRAAGEARRVELMAQLEQAKQRPPSKGQADAQDE